MKTTIKIGNLKIENINLEDIELSMEYSLSELIGLIKIVKDTFKEEQQEQGMNRNVRDNERILKELNILFNELQLSDYELENCEFDLCKFEYVARKIKSMSIASYNERLITEECKDFYYSYGEEALKFLDRIKRGLAYC